MNFENNSLQDICRVCLEKSDKLYPLHGQIPNVDEDISFMIKYCTLIEVTVEDGLPNAVCIPCFRTIRIAYNFIQQFKESNRRLLETKEKQAKYDNGVQKYTSSEIECNKQEESVQSCNNESVEEIIIEYNDFDSDVTPDNGRIIEGNYKNEEIKIIREDFCVEEQAYVKCENNFENDVEEQEEDGYRNIPINEKLQDELSEDLSESVLQEKDVQNFICPICGKLFLRFEVGFVKHLSSTHKDVKLKCNKCSLGTILTVDLYIQHFKHAHRFQCDICNKSYGWRSGLFYHKKTHKDRKIFKCSHKNCTRSFLTAWSLRKHFHTHSKSSKYVCSKCGTEFKTYGTYKYHQMTHDGNRSYLCTECGQTFLQSIHLKYHMWKHTGIKMFKCDNCDKSYTSQTQLKKHKRKKCGPTSQ